MSRQRDPSDLFNGMQGKNVLADFGGKAYQVVAAIGEEAFELIVALLVLVMVERTLGQQGLGIYAYLTAGLYAVRYMTQYGVSRFVERETAALTHQAVHLGRLIERAFQATIITALAGALVVLATAGFDTAHTKVQERIGAYLIAAMILPVANLNALKLSILQGMGKHAQVANLRMLRHGSILGGIFLLTRIQVPPSYLLVTFLVAEGVLAAKIRGPFKLPGFFTSFRNLRRLPDTLKQGQAYLFTDNALDVMLNIDLLVLGWFVSSWDLGVYAEAAVLVRFFLIVPVAIKPIVRRQYVIMASQSLDMLAQRLRRHIAILFSLSAMLTVYVMLHFPTVLDLFFETRGETYQSFAIFSVFVPGLLYYGTFLAQEPAYEALGRADALKRLSMSMAGANFILTLYLVPVAGFWGAAMATMLTMLVHFALFGRHLAVGKALDKQTLALAGLGIYLIYRLLKWLDLGAAMDMALAPLLVVLLVYACGIFNAPSQVSPANTGSAPASPRI